MLGLVQYVGALSDTVGLRLVRFSKGSVQNFWNVSSNLPVLARNLYIYTIYTSAWAVRGACGGRPNRNGMAAALGPGALRWACGGDLAEAQWAIAVATVGLGAVRRDSPIIKLWRKR